MQVFLFTFKVMFSDLNLFSQWPSAYMNSMTNLVEMSNGSVRNRGILMQKYLSVFWWYFMLLGIQYII